MDYNTSNVAKTWFGSKSILEKPLEFLFFLLLVFFIVLLDSFTIVIHGKNILQFFTPLPDISFIIINSLFFISLYAFLLIIFFKYSRKILGVLIGVFYVYTGLWRLFDKEKNTTNYHYPTQLRDKAYLQRDKFTLERVNEYIEKERAKELVDDVNFGLLILLGVNYFILGTYKDTHSFTKTIELSIANNYIVNGFINNAVLLIIFSFIIMLIGIILISLDPRDDGTRNKMLFKEEEEKK